MRIAISGLSGCGNTTACRDVSRALHLPILNYTFHDVADAFGVPFQVVMNAAKRDSRWDYALDAANIHKAERLHSWVAGSRLAAWRHDADLRIFLAASFDTRAKRISKREGKPLARVRAETRRRDARDIARYRKNYGINVNDLTGMDLVINTEQLTPQQVSALIVAAAKWAKKNRIRSPQPWSTKIKKTIQAKLKGATLQQLKKTLNTR